MLKKIIFLIFLAADALVFGIMSIWISFLKLHFVNP